jgi:hypothetical protein
MIEPGNASDVRLSKQTPLYVSKRSFKNFWQQYRIYLDRIELQCWMLLHTLKIPIREIVDIHVSPPFSLGKLLRRKGSLDFLGLKIDLTDSYHHNVITRRSRLGKHICFTPDDPEEFADIIKLLMEKVDQISS